VQAEAQFILADLTGAEQSARAAAEQYGEMNDFWGQADAQLLLGAVQLAAKQQLAAQISLLTALEAFQRYGDNHGSDLALLLLTRPTILLAARTVPSQVKRWPVRGAIARSPGLVISRKYPRRTRLG
jgi:hypothetical protein